MKAQIAKVRPSLKNNSLLSIGQLCDANCIAIFNKRKNVILKNFNVLSTGIRNFKDGLWEIKQPQNTAQSTICSTKTYYPSVNVLLPKDKNKIDLAKFYHAAICSPVLRTLQLAIKKDHFLSWPSISNINFPKYITDMLAIDKEICIRYKLPIKTKNFRATMAVYRYYIRT